MNERARWRVALYDRSDGTSPVAKFIEEQLPGDQAKILVELKEFDQVPTI
jgi:hypothetical protein